MSRLSDLIDELCPEGVEWKMLEEIGLSLSGMSAVSNKWADEGNCQFIDYMNAYKNIKIDVNNLPYATVKDTTKQAILRKGDVLFTGASEVPNECALSGVIEDDIRDGIFMDDHLLGLRLNDSFKDKIITGYLKYIFRADNFRKQVLSTVRGVTRFYIAKPAFMKLSIPVPPLPVQEEIVRILDKYSTLEVELEKKLEAELEARKLQYEYYRNKLLKFEDTQFKRIGDIAKCYAGATPSTSKPEYWENGTIPWMSSGEVNLGQVYSVEKKITQLGYDKSSTKMIPSNTVVIALAGQGKTRGTVAITRIELCTNQSLCAIVNDGKIINSDFLYHFLKSQYLQLRKVSSGDGTRGGLNLKMINDYKVPVPPLEEQQRIVSILDRFEKLTTDLTQGIPAEIEARRQQYEYYRDKLLTFKRKETVEA